MHKKREMRFNVGAKGFTLYLHTMFGMTDVREGVLVKVTSLYREMWLRVQCRKFSDQFCALKDQGLLSWPAYRESCPRILRLLASLHAALRRYKERRLKPGFLYLVPSPYKYAITVHSPLFTTRRRKAMKKIRLLRRKREAYSCASSTSSSVHGSNPSREVVLEGNTRARTVLKMTLIYASVIGLAYMIIYL